MGSNDQQSAEDKWPVSLYCSQSYEPLCNDQNSTAAPLLPSGLQLELTHPESTQETKKVQDVTSDRSTCPGNNSTITLIRPDPELLSGPPLPFATETMAPNPQLTYLDRVVMEIIETERMYVRDLRIIVEDYLSHIIDTRTLSIKPEQVCSLFGNIEDIYEFNSELLQSLDMCDNDPVAVARCFVDKREYFEIYTQYCTNYPNSVATLTDCMQNKTLAKFFRDRQAFLNSSLPLGSYLLKPVQRILKYHLLLQEIANHYDSEEEGYEVVEEAINTMTGVAWYINDMKRKHEHAVRVQEIQSLLINWKGPDLTTYGELVLEGTFHVQRAKNERTLFLFDKILLITKKRGENYIYKHHIMCSTLMLIESAKDSLRFSVTHYKHPKQPHTVQAKTAEEKRVWAHHIKRLILENHHAVIPQKAKEAILDMYSVSKYRYSPERLKNAMSCHGENFSGGWRRGRRQSEPGQEITRSTTATLKHAESEGTLLMDRNKCSLQPSASEHTLGLTPLKPEPQRSSMQELSLNTDSLLQHSLNDREEEMEDTELCKEGKELKQNDVEQKEEEESGDDSVTMGDDQNEDGNDLFEQNEPVRMESHTRFEEEAHDMDETFILTEEVSEELSPEGGLSWWRETESTEAIEPEIVPELPNRHPLGSERPNENGECIDCGENMKDFVDASFLLKPNDESEMIKTYNEKEFCQIENIQEEEEDLEDELMPMMESRNMIVPSFGLDNGNIIGEDIICSQSSCTLIVDSEEVETENTQTLIGSSTEQPPLYLTGETSISFPNLDGLLDTDQKLTKKGDTLSKKDRLLIHKIRRYYEHAEKQDASFRIRRRESLSYIPVGLVRNLSRQLNGISTDDNIAVHKKSAHISRPTSWDVFNLPGLEKEKVVERIPEPVTHDRVDGYSSNLSSQSVAVVIKDSESRPSSDVMKECHDIQVKVSEASMQSQETLKSIVGDHTIETSPDMLQKESAATTNPDSEYSEKLLIVEESDLCTTGEGTFTPTPTNISLDKRDEGQGQEKDSNEIFKCQLRSRVSQASLPKIISLRSAAEDDVILQDMERVKNKVFQLARQYSQRIKNNRLVSQRAKTAEGQLKPRNVLSVQEEIPKSQKSERAISCLMSLSSYEQGVQQESLTPSSAVPAQNLHSPIYTEILHWPDVQALRSKYSFRYSESIPSRPHPVSRSCSVPDKMLKIEPEMPSTQTSISNNSTSCNGTTEQKEAFADIKTSPNEALLNLSSGNEGLTKVCRVHSLDQVLGTLHLNEFQNHPETQIHGYYVSGESTLPGERKIIIIERLTGTKPEESLVVTGKEEKEMCEENQLGLKQSTGAKDKSKEKVVGSHDMVDIAKKYPVTSLKNTESSQQSVVKNLREKFQSLSSFT
ncbi:pleckstrin homology domain-containing family G member 3 isoform X2 [Chanos chanos]|uniref:Pleckstrin homology domain-containing family G member 3 isoform X2 n=1 Tax=Chanos chanos TaxID=29144 RepID=A0A6J2VCV9_CHACN|nr:pleckstrin homology domain-containing family G member 3-like isoform X2 [Chanos chanos]